MKLTDDWHGDLRERTPEELLALTGRILDELLQRGIVRSTNNPVADYSEYLTAKAFGLRLVANANAGFDAISEAGTRFQVKARRLTPRNGSRQLGFVRGMASSADPFDFLVGILFDTNFRVIRAALIPVGVVRQLARRVDYVNAWRIILADSVWTIPGVEDCTERIVGAASSAPTPPTTIVPIPSAESDVSGITWAAVLARYADGRSLRTRHRARPFDVQADADGLLVTPSTGSRRRIPISQVERALSTWREGSIAALRATTFNSSYFDAIIEDMHAALATPES